MTITEFQAYDLYKYYPDVDNDRYYNYHVRKKNKLIRGAKYMLKGLECDGFDMPARVYQVVALVNSIHDVVLDSVVMRQLSGFDNDVKFTLSKQECQVLHVKYEPGLQLFPAGMRWKKWNERAEERPMTVFDPEDLSTYATSRIDGNIRHIILKIDRFHVEGNYVIDNEQENKSWTIDRFIAALKVTSKNPLVKFKDALSNGMMFYKKDELIPYRIIMPEDSYAVSSSMTTSESLFIELYLKKPTRGLSTEDGITGIPPRVLVSKSARELFNIYVDEFKLNKKKSRSAIDHYNVKTGDRFVIPQDAFVGNLAGEALKDFSKDMAHRRGRVGDVMYDPESDRIMFRSSQGTWSVLSKYKTAD